MALLMGTFVVTFIASLLGGNMGDILSMLPYNFLSYLSVVVPMTLIAVITAFVAQFTRSSSLTVVIMIFASILMSAVSLFVPQIVSLLPTTYLSWYQNFYNGVNFVRVLNEFLYILSYGIIFMFAGTYVFQQKDI
jgi:ABC-2 type transport system permease protein